MISSMTGFGRGSAQLEGISVTVELRTVNNRFCEVSLRGPREINPFEAELQRAIKGRVARGRVSAHVQVDQGGSDGPAQKVDLKAATGYRDLLTSLQDAAGIGGEIRLDHLLRFPDIFVQQEDDAGAEERLKKATKEALDGALDGLHAMRQKEGVALRTELILRVENIAAGLASVEERAPERIPLALQRVRERIAEIAGDIRIDAERVEQEIVMLADKLDVTEECVRLHSHLDQFRKTLDSTEPVGRRLNFLSQEINREVNTIGSKANDAEMGHIVVSMKEELEKIREQVENVE